MKDKKGYLALIGVFIFALLIRLIYLYQLKSGPLFGFFAPDSYFYDKFALKILAGNFVYGETVYLNPLYPFFLSAIYTVFGHNLTAVAFVQIILDSFTCALLYLICIKIFNKKNIALTASFIYASYGIAIFYTGFLLDVTLVVFLHAGLILTLLYAKAKKGFALWLLCGILTGLIMLLKANIIFFLPFLALWLFRTREIEEKIRKRIIVLMLIFAGIVIVLVPFSIRNYMIEGRFSPFPVQGGLNFYIGNNPAARGNYMSLSGMPDSPVEQAKASIRRAEQQMRRELTPREASRHWFARGLRFIKTNPRQYLLLTFRKLFLFWNKAEVDGNLNYYFGKRFLPVLNFPFFSFGVIAPLAVLGFIFAAGRGWPGASLIMLFIFAHMGSVLLYFINSRYRLPVVPFLIIFAAYALQNFFRLLRSVKIKESCLFFLLLLAFFFIVNTDMYKRKMEELFFTDHTNLGVVYHEKGMLDAAVAEFQKALRINPDYAQAYHNLGIVYTVKALPEAAIQQFQKALRINPDYAEAHYNLGVAYERKGLNNQAVIQYGKAISANPDFPQAYNNLGAVYGRKGELGEAIIQYQRAIKLDPDYRDAQYNLGIVYDGQGKLDMAKEKYRKAVEVDPDFSDAYYNLGFVYDRQGKLEEAIGYYQKTLSLDSNFTEAHNNLAVVYYRQGNIDKAREHYLRALELGQKVSVHFFQELFKGSVQLLGPKKE